MLQKRQNSRSIRASEPSTRQTIRIPLLGGRIEGDLISFNNLSDGREHVAIRLGPVETTEIPLVRLHSECLTGDVFGSCRCDCGPQLHEALLKIYAEGGVILYLRQEGRDIGLYNKIDAYALQSKGFDTYEANRRLSLPEDKRTYTFAAEMLRALGIPKIRLLSNNPDKAAQLARCGIDISETVQTSVFLSSHNREYLTSKVTHTHHNIDLGNQSRE